MLIPRTSYLEKIRPFYASLDLVKVLVGMRRVGKSSLMALIAEDMRRTSGAKKNAFFAYNFEDWANHHLLDANALHQELERKCTGAKVPPVFFLDEIQNVPGWERVVNSIRSRGVANIFLTGSNSMLLSGELATHLAGRTVSFEVFPFSFAEYLSALRLQGRDIDVQHAFLDYLKTGGLPGLLHYEGSPESARTYLRDLFDSCVMKDMVQRWKIRDVELLDRTLLYMLEQIGHPLSGNSIEKYLKSEQRKVSKDTVINFMNAAEKTFLFHRVDAEDTIGKRIFQFRPKFYVTDLGLRDARLGNNSTNIDQVLENVVCLELLRRGWTVHTGHVGEREIDFIAQKGDRRMYLQISYLLASSETTQREFGSLLEIPDNYPKFVLSMDCIKQSQKGIQHDNIADFLLDQTW